MTIAASTRVSVIVPVFGPAPYLPKCLAALANQTYPKNLFEIVVVDNNDPIRHEDLVSGLPGMRFAHEPVPGSYATRNTGIRVSKGALLAFTDADCIPAPNWIARGVEQMDRDPATAMIGGRIEFAFTNPSQPTVVELYQAIMGFRQQGYLEHDGFAATANMFTRRSVFDEVGPFDEALKSSGDVDWGQRVRVTGAGQRFDAELVVTHPARKTLGELRSKFARLGGGMQDLARKRGRGLRSMATDVPITFFPFWTLVECVSDTRLRGVFARVRMAALVLLLGSTLGIERIRVQCGGRARRA